MRRAAAFALTAVLALAGCVPIFARGGDVPYVQTPDRVVQEMLALAGVGPDDVGQPSERGQLGYLTGGARLGMRPRTEIPLRLT